MKFMLLVSWDADRMNAEEEPKPGEREEESFPWLDDLQARNIWLTGDRLAPPRQCGPKLARVVLGPAVHDERVGPELRRRDVLEPRRGFVDRRELDLEMADRCVLAVVGRRLVHGHHVWKWKPEQRVVRAEHRLEDLRQRGALGVSQVEQARRVAPREHVHFVREARRKRNERAEALRVP